MVTVPLLGNGNAPSAQPTNLPNAQIQPAEGAQAMGAALGEGGRQLQQLGDAAVGAANTASSIFTDAQDQANQVRVQDALNQARSSALSLAYDPQSGYINQKGEAAFDRPSGVPLAQEYGDQLNQNIGDISSNLGNDAQRRMFNMEAGNIQTDFQRGVQQHTLEQFTNYHNSVDQGAVALASNSAELNWQNPQAIDSSINSAKASTYNLAMRSGMSADQATSSLQVLESGIRTKVVDAALESNNPAYASQYFNTYKSAFTANDSLELQSKLNAQVDAHIAQSTVHDTTVAMMPGLAPTSLDRLHSITMGMESNGQRFQPDGTLTTSPTGAQGEMQVEPATATNPGFGVTPAQNNSPDELKRVGDDYLTAMVQRYGGSPDKALAAYNAGPGALDKAIATAQQNGTPANWLQNLPAETQAYVTKGVQQFNSGVAPPIPTKYDFVNNAVTQLGPNPRPQLLSLTMDQAEKQYDLMQSSRTEQGNNALKTAQQALISNGGNFAALDPSIKQDLVTYDPAKYDAAQTFARGVANPNIPTNALAYTDAITHPETLSQMSDPDFSSYAMANFAPGKDRDLVTKMRADEINGTVDTTSQAINTKYMTQALNQRLADVGVVPASNNADDKQAYKNQVANITKYVSDDIFAQQQQIGQKMTPAQISTRLDQLFADRTAPTQSSILGIDVGSQTPGTPLIAQQKSGIPQDDLTQITAALAKQGVNSPTDGQILRTYWTAHRGQGQPALATKASASGGIGDYLSNSVQNLGNAF